MDEVHAAACQPDIVRPTVCACPSCGTNQGPIVSRTSSLYFEEVIDNRDEEVHEGEAVSVAISPNTVAGDERPTEGT